MQLWLISDMHLKHSNMYKFLMPDGTRVRYEFRDEYEGDAYMCQKWCELVKPSDHIYNLGDVSMERSSASKEWFVNTIRSLPGHKRLILGNHDHLALDVYRDAGFEKIKGSHKLDRLLLSHFPIHESSIPKWSLGNVHGHTHRNPNITPIVDKTTESVKVWLNVCVEHTNYEPVPIEEVVAKLEKIRSKTLSM